MKRFVQSIKIKIVSTSPNVIISNLFLLSSTTATESFICNLPIFQLQFCAPISNFIMCGLRDIAGMKRTILYKAKG
jgi:hypothetical protein